MVTFFESNELVRNTNARFFLWATIIEIKKLQLIYLLICLIPFCFNAQLNKHKKELKSLFQNSHNGAQVSIGYIEGDNLNFLGFRKKDDKFQWVKNQDYVYEIGSITKVFTSYFLSTSISNNKVSLNDSVFKSLLTYLKALHISSYLITSNLVRDNFLDPYSSYTEEKFISYYPKGKKSLIQILELRF